MPVASDVPMIDAILVESRTQHPYGVRGVGETRSSRRSVRLPTP